MRARSTLDWSQTNNNISCFYFFDNQLIHGLLQ